MSAAYNGPWPDDSGAPGAHIFGWMSPRELDWLHDQATRMNSVAEIGSFKGRSTFALLTGCDGPVYSVDKHEPQGPTRQWGSSYPEFIENVGHFKNLIVVKEWSPAAASMVPSVDMCFIDGDHTEEGLEADLEAWVPKTRVLLCGHDYDHAAYPGVTRVVDRWFPERTILADTGIWVLDVVR